MAIDKNPAGSCRGEGLQHQVRVHVYRNSGTAWGQFSMMPVARITVFREQSFKSFFAGPSCYSSQLSTIQYILLIVVDQHGYRAYIGTLRRQSHVIKIKGFMIYIVHYTELVCIKYMHNQNQNNSEYSFRQYRQLFTVIRYKITQ